MITTLNTTGSTRFRAWHKAMREFAPDTEFLVDAKGVVWQWHYANGNRTTIHRAVAEVLISWSTGREAKEGHEIFGDDIVDFEGVRAVVRWDECGMWYFDPMDEDAWCEDWNFQDDAERCRVIGNVHANPNLLKSA